MSLELDASIKWVDPVSLKPHPKNTNKHPEDQIERLSNIIKYQGWRQPIVVSKRSDFIVAGHGRLAAAQKLGLKEVPVSFQHFDDETQELAHMTADNAIASWAELDLNMIKEQALDFDDGFDLDLLGVKELELDLSSDEDKESKEDVYTKKIEAPIYEIKGDKPALNELFDDKKNKELVSRIKEADIEEKTREFLLLAASRHIVFNYENIAEFYAHSDKDTQELFEESALVIVDFDKAIEHGFVTMTEELAEAYDEQQQH